MYIRKNHKNTNLEIVFQLSKERALKLEAMAQNYEDKLAHDIIQTGVKRWSSLDKLSVNRRSVAILS